MVIIDQSGRERVRKTGRGREIEGETKIYKERERERGGWSLNPLTSP